MSLLETCAVDYKHLEGRIYAPSFIASTYLLEMDSEFSSYKHSCKYWRFDGE